jgi:LL-diaminopimelate aminotransferase
MAGNTGPIDQGSEYSGLVYLRATAANSFSPEIPKNPVDIIYLCSPNNPTGTVISRERLTQWVEYARENSAIILFDAAYEAYIADPSLPHSIYEIPGAREVAIEFRSFSKTAGFTGVRAAYTVVPTTLMGKARDGQSVDLHRLWHRRHTTRFNGISYIVQRGCEATYSEAGIQQVRMLVEHYMNNAKIIRERLGAIGMTVYGGVNAPYAWVKTPDDLSSWDFFDTLLKTAHVVSTPGSGFGASGEGYIRLSAFNSRQNVEEAMTRIARQIK